MSTKRTRTLVAAALCCVATLLPVQPAAAERAAAPNDEHCVLNVTGQRDDGELITGAQKCYATFTEAMAAVGIDTTATRPMDLDPAALRSGEEDEDIIIAIHYDYWSLGGSSVTVAGVLCTGGWLNLPTNWKNRISSTASGVCSQITHFDLPNKLGTTEDTFPSGNLSTLNNKAESIQYL